MQLISSKSTTFTKKKAAETAGVSRTSLRRRLNGMAVDKKAGRPTVLSPQEEKAIIDSLIFLAHRGVPLTMKMLKMKVAQIVSDGRFVPFNNTGAGKHWATLFLKRHSNRISIRKAHIYEACRDLDRDENMLRKFYEAVTEVVREGNFQPMDIWNLDETGICGQGKKGEMVIAQLGDKMPSAARSNSRENVTLLLCINAAGKYLPPLYIFKGERLNSEWTQNGPEGALFTVSKKSYMNSEIFYEWIKFFCQQVPDRSRKQMIFFDGHRSHVTEEVIQYAREQNIELFQFVSHTSHISQPLDVAVFHVFKSSYESALHMFSLTHGGLQPRKADLVELTKEPLKKCLTEDNIISAFRGAGIWPVDGDHAINRMQRKQSKKKNQLNHEPDFTFLVSKETIEQNLSSPVKRKMEEQGICLEESRVHTIMCTQMIQPKKRRRIAKGSETWLDEGGLLTSDAIQEKIAAKKAKKIAEDAAKEEKKRLLKEKKERIAAEKLLKAKQRADKKVGVQERKNMVVEDRLCKKYHFNQKYFNVKAITYDI